MLAKRLELKNISPCRVPKPNVPENIKKECETYIAFWDQKIYEENKNNNLKPNNRKDDDSIETVTKTIEYKNNNLKPNNTKDDDSIETVTETIEYFVTEQEAETYEDFDLTPLKRSPVKGNVNTVGKVISNIEEEQLDFGDKLIKYIECSIDFQCDMKKKKRYIVWLHLLWENDGYQWYRFEGLQNDLPYTTCAVCNQNPLLLRAIYKYETLQQPELYQSCPPDEGNDIQPNKIKPIKKTTTSKNKKKEKSKKRPCRK